MAEKKHRVGLLGGTFDPIHIGHLMLAEAVRDEYELEQVLFIPAAQPPHKLGRKISPAEDRYMMTVLATCSNPTFEVSDIEMRREGPSYSVDTVRALLGDLGVRQIHLLNTPELEISSTDIRERVARGASIRYIVPREVEQYIYKKGLYR